MKETAKKITAIILIESFVSLLVPAAEIRNEMHYIEASGNYYDFNSVVTMQDFEKHYEIASENELVCDDVFWKLDDEGFSIEHEETDGLVVHKSRLYEQLLEAKTKILNENFGPENIQLENEISKKREEWKNEANKIISEYLAGYKNEIKDENQVKSEFYSIEQEVFNSLLSELLYDHSSLKKLSEEDTALAILNELTNEVENETQNNFNLLFGKIDAEIKNPGKENVELESAGWFKELEKQIEIGIEKWDEIEKDFLAAKSEWENKAEKNYAESVEQWNTAYEKLLDKRSEWNKEIENKIEQGKIAWEAKYNELNENIKNSEKEYFEEIYADYEQKKELLEINKKIYTETRKILETVCSSIENWTAYWSEKYDGIYSYWKTENPLYRINITDEKSVEKTLCIIDDVKFDYLKTIKDAVIQKITEENSQEFFGILNRIDLCNTESSAGEIKRILQSINYSCSFSENPVLEKIMDSENFLWSELENLKEWVLSLGEYWESACSTLEKIVKVATGEDENGNVKLSTDELDAQIEKIKIIENYWNDRKEIEKAVYEYSVKESAQIETKEQTLINLETAEKNYLEEKVKYEEEKNILEQIKREYENAKEEYKIQSEKVNDILILLEAEESYYENLLYNNSEMDNTNDISKLSELVNQVNSVNPDSSKNKEYLDEYIKYNFIIEYKNAEKLRKQLIENMKGKTEYNTSGSNREKTEEELKIEQEEKEKYLSENGITEEEYNAREDKYTDVSIEELKEIIQEKIKNEEDYTEELNYLEYKNAVVEFLTEGKIKNENNPEVDYEAIKNNYSDYILEVIESKNNDLRNKIAEMILKAKAEDERFYLSMSDEKIESFFTSIDQILEKEKSSSTVKMVFELFKQQISKARDFEKEKEQIDLLISDVNKNSGKTNYSVSGIDYFISNYEDFFINPKNEPAAKLAGEKDVSQVELNKSRNNIFDYESDYKNKLYLLTKYAENFNKKVERYKNIVSDIDTAKENVELLKRKYEEEVKKLNGGENSVFSLLTEIVDKYNSQIQKIENEAERVKDFEIEYEKASGIYDYAENKYLHEIDENEVFLTPEEKYKSAEEKLKKTQELRMLLENKRSVYDENKSLSEPVKELQKEYETVLRDYQKINVLNTEVSYELKKMIEKLKKIQVEKENVFDELVVETDENDFTVSDAVRELVIVKTAENTDGSLSYDFELNENYGGNQSETWDQMYLENFKKYVTERSIVRYYSDGKERTYSKSRLDAIDFLNEMSRKDYSLCDLLLASCYAKELTGKEVFSENENPHSKDVYALDIPKDNLFAFNFPEEYESARMGELKKAYEKVTENGGKNDIAKMIVFSEYNIGDVFSLKELEIDETSFRSLEVLIERVIDKKEGYLIEAAVFAGLGAALTIIAAIPFGWWALVPLAAAIIGLASCNSSAEALSAAAEDLEKIQNGYKELADEKSAYSNSVLGTWIKLSDNEKKELDKFNLYKYGNVNGTGIELNWENFISALNDKFKPENETLFDSNFYNDVKACNIGLNSLKEIFEKATEGIKVETVSDGLTDVFEKMNEAKNNQFDKLASFVKDKQKKHSEAQEDFSKIIDSLFANGTDVNVNVEKTVEKLFGENSWNQESFNRSMIETEINSMIKNIPVRISREEEKYITECFDDILEYYDANLLNRMYFLSDVKYVENENEIENLKMLKEQWNAEIEYVKRKANAEWKKAEEKINSDFNKWKKQWKSAFENQQNEWKEEYSDFLSDKYEWVNSQYLNVGLNGIGEDKRNGFEVTSKIKNDLVIKIDELKKLSPDNESFFENGIEKYIDSIFDETKLCNLENYLTKKSDVIDLSFVKNILGIKSVDSIVEQQSYINKMANLEKTLIEKTAKSTAMIERQKLESKIKEVLGFVQQKNKEMEDWEIELVKKDGYTVGQEISREAVVDSTVMETAIRKKQTVHKYEWFECGIPVLSFDITMLNYLDSKEITDRVTESQKNLSEWKDKILGNERNPGDMAYHIGSEPSFIEHVDVKKSKNDNLLDKGSGELGFILSDYMWNSIVNREGYAEMGKPLYDKKFTEDNMIFGIRLPTLRELTQMVCDIVGSCTGQEWLKLVDDLLFGMLDLQFETRSIGDVFKDLLKQGISIGFSAAGSFASKTIEGLEALSNIEKLFLNSSVNIGTNYLNNVSNSYVDAMSFEKGFSFDWEKANSSWTDENIWKNALSSGVTTFVKGGTSIAMNNLTLTDGIGKNLNSSIFNTKGMFDLNDVLSTGAASLSEKLITGKTTVNLFSLNDLGLNLKNNVGLLSMTWDDDGVSFALDNSGMQLGVGKMFSAFGGIGDAMRVTDAKIKAGAGSYDAISKVNMVNALGWSGMKFETAVGQQIWNNKLNVYFNKINGEANTNEKVINISNGLVENSETSAVTLASLAAHEATHFFGGNEMDARLEGYKLFNSLREIYEVDYNENNTIYDITHYSDILKNYGEKDLFNELFFSDCFENMTGEYKYYFANIKDPGYGQNTCAEDRKIPLGNGYLQNTVNEYNHEQEENAYIRYLNDKYFEYVVETEEPLISYYDFIDSDYCKCKDIEDFRNLISCDKNKQNSELQNYYYETLHFYDLANYGCTLASAAYSAYSLSGKLYTFREVNDIAIKNDFFVGLNSGDDQKNKLLYGNKYADLINTLAEEKVVEYWQSVSNTKTDNSLVGKSILNYENSVDKFIGVVRVKGQHTTVFNGNFDFFEKIDYNTKKKEKKVTSIDVLNPWKNSSSWLGETKYSINDVSRIDYYHVIETEKTKKQKYYENIYMNNFAKE